MFTDEVGDTLVEVKKYDETEPIMTPEPDEESIMNVVESTFMQAMKNLAKNLSPTLKTSSLLGKCKGAPPDEDN